MATEPGGSGDEGYLHQETKRTKTTAEPISPLRTLLSNTQRRVTRAFCRDDNVHVPEVPDAGQSVVTNQWEEKEPHVNRSNEEDLSIEIQPSTQP